MTRKATFALPLVLLFLSSLSAAAQTVPPVQAKVNIIIDRELIRFAPQETAQELRLVVTDQTGTELYDSGTLPVSTLDWLMRDSRGEAMKGGLYLYTLTVKDAAGETSQRRGYVIINRAGDAERVWVATGDKVGIGSDNEAQQMTVVGSRDATVGVAELPAAERGTYVASGRGLNERAGLQRDALGRNIAEPNNKAEKDLRLTTNTTGTGTAGQLAKWTGTNGTASSDVGNSVLTELNGNIGIGTTNPLASFHASRSDGSYQYKMERTGTNAHLYGFGADSFGNFFLDDVTNVVRRLTLDTNGNVGLGTAVPSASVHASRSDGSYQFKMERTGTNAHVYGFGADSFGNFFLDDVTNVARRMTISTTGNVGIDTTNPTAKLHVGGTVGVDGIRFPDGTLMTSAGVGSSSNLTNAVDAVVNADADGNGSGAVRLQTNAADRLIITNGGNVGIGVPNPAAKLEIAGTAKTNGLNVAGTTQTSILQITGGADLSEQFEVKATSDSNHNSPQQLQPGLLVSIDPLNPGKLVVSSQAYDRRVAGIISGAGGVKTGLLMGQVSSVADGDYPVALSGRVYCWADAANGSIEPGDLLTASNTPGHAMKVSNHKKAQGAVIGKAMSGLKQGKGLVLVLVTLQ